MADHLPSITERFAVAFNRSGLSQTELARRIGVTRASINGWLHGRYANLRPENLFHVADALGVEARWLATGDGPMEAQRLSPAQRQLIEDYHALDDEGRTALATLAHQIAESKERYS